MVDLHTTYLGLPLRTPLVASAGPFSGEPDRIPGLAEAGASAIVLPSLFQEQIERGHVLAHGPGPDEYLELVERAVGSVDVPIIASLNGVDLGGWLRYARLIEDAGAAAVELNLYSVAADPTRDAADLEAEHLDVIRVVASEVSIPVAVKISPYYTSLAAFVVEVERAGASGVVMFNRFYAPDLDLETLGIRQRAALSSPSELVLPLRWIGITRELLTISIAASTGVHDGSDAVKVLLTGADVAMTTSALMIHGTGHLAAIERGLIEWMRRHEYASVSEMRGLVRRDAIDDPSAFERLTYVDNLTSYATRFRTASTDAWRGSRLHASER